MTWTRWWKHCWGGLDRMGCFMVICLVFEFTGSHAQWHATSNIARLGARMQAPASQYYIARVEFIVTLS